MHRYHEVIAVAYRTGKQIRKVLYRAEAPQPAEVFRRLAQRHRTETVLHREVQGTTSKPLGLIEEHPFADTAA